MQSPRRMMVAIRTIEDVDELDICEIPVVPVGICREGVQAVALYSERNDGHSVVLHWSVWIPASTEHFALIVVEDDGNAECVLSHSGKLEKGASTGENPFLVHVPEDMYSHPLWSFDSYDGDIRILLVLIYDEDPTYEFALKELCDVGHIAEAQEFLQEVVYSADADLQAYKLPSYEAESASEWI